jgi:aminopeptidase N
MKPNTPNRVFLKDYQPPHYWIDQVDLEFHLSPKNTRVIAKMKVRANPDHAKTNAPLILDGEELELLRVELNGRPMKAEDYTVSPESLTIPMVPRQFELLIETQIHPETNTTLQGLYRSSGNYCTQCEAMGFRRITYYVDRPDVLARFTTRIEASKKECPVMLSNGNRVDGGELADGRHWVKWEDPFPKAAYLFALVAGDLVCIADKFKTKSGRNVDLHIYVETENADKCDHAMHSLKEAMQWDEEKFGLEYDLDIYMIVAVNDFNMGAMENKGLNVFNSKYVLAKPDSATDMDFQAIETVIGHEYFHNWTGNRVTLRDWFQLSLKEGLTVFRDQQFSADMGSRALKRIDDVKIIRTAQFAEDAGPMAHPIRPESYIEMNNFYTVTVYNKGAEVIRMIHTLLGPEGFRKGMDLYIARHDGFAVTTDDFVSAMEDANDKDLKQFRLWYQQAGTPSVQAEWRYQAAEHSLEFQFNQTIPDTHGQTNKKPMHIPIRLGLINQNGNAISFLPPGGSTPVKDWVFELTENAQSLVLKQVNEPAIPSLLRDFSAPIRLSQPLSQADRLVLVQSDSDPINQWDASVNLLLEQITLFKNAYHNQQIHTMDAELLQAFAQLMADTQRDPALIAQMCSVPSLNYLIELQPKIDIDGLDYAREHCLDAVVAALEPICAERYQQLAKTTNYELNAEAIANRTLKNTCLVLLAHAGKPEYFQFARHQYETAENMTDSFAALRALLNSEYSDVEAVVGHFYEKWRHSPLVMDKWLAVQATAQREDVFNRVKKLIEHPVFDIKNPNKVYALLNAFARQNLKAFHAESGEAYRFIANQVLEIDALNPQVASRLVGAFTTVRRMDDARSLLMKTEIERMLGAPKLSKDVYEILIQTQQG